MADIDAGDSEDRGESARRLIASLRELMRISLGLAKPLTTEAFAREISRRLGDDKRINSSTIWRWMKGKSVPSRATIESLRRIGDELSRGRYDPTPESAVYSPDKLAMACVRARTVIVAEVLENTPHRLLHAERAAQAAENLLVILNEYLRVSEVDAEAVIRWAVVSALPRQDAAWFQPKLHAEGSAELSVAELEAAQRWYFYPSGQVARLVVALAKSVGEMARVP